MKRLREIGQKERRKTGKRWMAIALALSFLVIGGGVQGRVNAAPAVDAALPSESTVLLSERRFPRLAYRCRRWFRFMCGRVPAYSGPASAC